MKKAVPTVIVIVVAAVLAGWGILGGWFGSGASNKVGDLYEAMGLTDDSGQHLSSKYGAIVLNHELQDTHAIYDNGIFLPIDFVNSAINARFYWDSNAKKILYTTDQGTTEISQDSEGIYIVNDKVYLSTDLISQYSDVIFKSYTGPNRLVITNDWNTSSKQVQAKKDVNLRADNTKKADILKECKEGETFTLLEQVGDWDRILTEDGITGFAESKKLASAADVKAQRPSTKEQEQTATHNLLGDNETVSLAWHQVYSYSGNDTLSQHMQDVEGVNVISPTWFSVKDADGNLNSFADAAYVTKAHQMGMKVWPLIADFDSNNKRYTQDVLPDSKTRARLVSNIVAALKESGADGINVDFEYVKADFSADYLQFLRELALECHKAGKVVSVDNYVPSKWTKQYNRLEEISYADYLCIMAYDEHNSSSEEAGSVASLSFVKKGIKDTISEVGQENASRVVCAIPFYTRLWKIAPEEDAKDGDKIITDPEQGTRALSSQAIGMEKANEVVTKNNAKKSWNEEAGQYYVEYKKGTSTYKMWMEDAKSIAAKLDLFKEDQIGGAAYWSLGFETGDVWKTIQEKLK